MPSIFDVYKTQEISVTIKSDKRELKVKPNTLPLDIFDKEQNYVGVYCNNELQSLNEPILIDSELDPVVAGSADSIDMLKKTLSFIL